MAMKSKVDSSGSHPSRQQMIMAAKTDTVPFAAHLNRCRVCHELFEYLSLANDPGDLVDWEAAEELIDKCARIPLLVESRTSARHFAGSVDYDSWSQLPAAQLRDAAQGLERRLSMSAAGVTLEVVAERRPRGWDFVARAYRQGNVVSSEFVLHVGREELLSGSVGCFTWSSLRPPMKLQLCSPDERIEFKGLKSESP